MKATKEQLLNRIKYFLDLPGVCAQSKRNTVLTLCENMSLEQLGLVSAALRIRVRGLIGIARSPQRFQEIKSARDKVGTFFSKYGAQS